MNRLIDELVDRLIEIKIVVSGSPTIRAHLASQNQVKSSQVELYCHSAACGDIQWNEMSCLTGPRCYINTDIQHYKPIHKLTYMTDLTRYTIYKCLPYTTKR